MIHIYTKTRNADSVWFKGIKCAFQSNGGGRLIRDKHGIEVWARDPARLFHWFDALQALHRLEIR